MDLAISSCQTRAELLPLAVFDLEVKEVKKKMKYTQRELAKKITYLRHAKQHSELNQCAVFIK